MNNNSTKTFSSFIELLDAKVTKTSATHYLENHPEEGSMFAYTDVLTYFNIENAAAKVTRAEIKELPTPFITHLGTNGGTFTLIRSISDNTIEWLDTQKGWVSTKCEDFFKDWSGIVLLAEANKKSGETDYKARRKIEILKNIRLPLALGLLTFILLFAIVFAPSQSIVIYITLFLKLTGMFIVSLIFIKSIGVSNGWSDKFCTTNTKISCQSILDSPAAKITPWFSWSDAGFIYLFGSFFGLLFSLGSTSGLNTSMSLQMMFSAVTILFAVYSLHYQAVKAKIWCPTCLGVISVFMLETLVLTIHISNAPFEYESAAAPPILFGVMIPIIFLLLFKNVLKKAEEGKNIYKELNKLKSSPAVFEALMSGQRQMPDIPQDMQTIELGNTKATHTLTMVSNPLCSPCAKMHLRVEHLLAENNDIRCKVIFLSKTDSNDVGGQFVRKLFSLPQELRANALEKWFYNNTKNFNVWNEEFIDYQEQDLCGLQKYHNSWVSSAQIKATPALFIDGRLLPETMHVDDLPLHLNHLTTTTKFKYGFANHFI